MNHAAASLIIAALFGALIDGLHGALCASLGWCVSAAYQPLELRPLAHIALSIATCAALMLGGYAIRDFIIGG